MHTTNLEGRKNLMRTLCFLLLTVSFALFFFDLDVKPFRDYDEATYAKVIRDTQNSGDILTLKKDGAYWFEKPPLYFWTSMAIATVIPEPEFAYRVTAAFSGVLSIVFVMLVAFELSSGSFFVSLLAGLVLLSTGHFVEAARQVRLDVPTVACILIATYCFTRGQKNKVWLLGVGPVIAIGVLFKSVVALFALPFLTIWLLIYSDREWLRSIHFWSGVVGAGLLLAPWHLYESAHHGLAFWQSYLYQQVAKRLTENFIESQLSAFSYFKFIVRYVVPWGLVFFGIIVAIVAKIGRGKLTSVPKPLVVTSFSTATILLLLSLSATKLDYYLIPVYPYMALSIALATAWIAPILWKQEVAREYIAIGGILIFALAFATCFSFVSHSIAYLHTDDLIATDERNAGLIIAGSSSLPLYSYEYDYQESLKYYGDRAEIHLLRKGAIISGEFLLVTTPGQNELLPSSDYIQLLYEGPKLSLIHFQNGTWSFVNL